MTSISSSLTAAASLLQQNLFNRIDANSDGKVSKAEFVAGKPKNVTDAQAADLYAKIDTGNTDGLTKDQLDAGLKANRPQPSGQVKLGQDVIGALLNLVQTTNPPNAGGNGADGTAGSAQPQSAVDRFNAIDTDHDGKVSQAEFVAARPKGVSEDQANKLFTSIDSTNTGSITESQFAASGPKGAHGHHHHAHGAGGPPPPDAATDTTTTAAADTTTITDATATTTASATTASTSSASTSSKALSALMDAIKAYASYNKLTLDTSSLVSTAA